MREYSPIIIISAIIGIISTLLIIALLKTKNEISKDKFDRHMKDTEILKRVSKYAKPYAKSFIFVGFLIVISIAYDIVSPLIVGHIEEMITTDFELKKLFGFVALYAGILLVSIACTYIQAVVLQITGQKIISAIREDLYKHIQSFSHSQLNNTPIGKLATRITNDTNSLSLIFTSTVALLAKNLFIIIGVLVAMFCLNYQLAIMVVCFTPFVLFFTVVFRKFTRNAFRKVKDGTTDINTFLSENLSGMKIIQIFNREDKKRGEFREKNLQLAKAKREQIFVMSVFRPLVYMLYVSSVLCLLYLGGKGYIDNTSFLGQTLTAATVVSFYMYISKFFTPIQNLAEQFNWLQSAFASAEKIFTLFDIEPEIQDAEDAIELENVEGNIEFRDVWFSYVPGEWVLKGVSFKVKAGQTVAFVGSTGSGKTTILSLLCRNYDIQKGEILIDGIDIRRVKISSLRKQFGQMLQDVFLFSGTVRSNIVLRDVSHSDEEIMDVCRYVNADRFIERLKDGLDEEVRERGNNFSAGQRQLISFARTIISKPKIMILDEATANIDTETEQLIQKSLERMMNIGTMLVVAHRLSTIKNADNIIVMSDGVIIEQGTHDELMSLKGKYYLSAKA